MLSAASEPQESPGKSAIPLVQHRALLEEKDAIIAQQTAAIETLNHRIEMLEEGLRLLNRKHFAPSSEIDKVQASLFNEAELAACEGETETPPKKPAKRKKPTGRKGLSDKIPREQVRVELTGEEKEGALNTFFVVVKEELDITPAKVQVIQYLQEKAIFNTAGKRQVKAAKMPKHPLGKAIASINLLAYLIIAKYMDALPLNRMERILKRYGGGISRATMAGWLIRLSWQLQPLIHLIRDHQLHYEIIQMDETRVKVLKQPGYASTSDKYMWLMRGGPPDQPSVIFHYDPSRKGDVPVQLLEDFDGYLQTDGYSGYDPVIKQNKITQLGCWDHARRKFKDAQDAGPKGQPGMNSRLSNVAIEKIKPLYVIEAKLRKEKAEAEEIYRVRQEESLPLLEDLKAWAEENRHKVPKDSLTGKAFTYLTNQWPRLIVYCQDGRLQMSNILTEQAVRPFAIGRKNWLFSDTPKGAAASALYYSLIETAKANGLEPYEYLRYILKRLPYATTVEELEMLLPWNVKILMAVEKSSTLIN